ncbi:MAG TPA: potassium channel protein [Candidatus Cloacimonetes bacterium]|nr:potassium channel protein [Candidatus Cloacimonadota bacterium]
MKGYVASKLLKKFLIAGSALLIIIFGSTAVYWFIAGDNYSMMDCLYMTIVTISTIGYAEIIDLSGNNFGRIFTMIIAFTGIGILTYVLSTITAFTVEGELKATFRRRKMEKKIERLKNHYIVCGVGQVGLHIINELYATGRNSAIITQNEERISRLEERFPGQVYIEGDPIEDIVLKKAGIEKAIGLFAAMDDDNKNLIISLSARQMNPNLKIVASCHNNMNAEKMKRAGANAVVSSTLIGGLRMASEMIRPTVVTFLDTMLRDTNTNLRIEETPLPDSLEGKQLKDLNLKQFKDTLLLAVRTKIGWIYNPDETYTIGKDNSLIIMTTPNERTSIEKYILKK